MYIDINAAGCPNACRHCAVTGHRPTGDFFTPDELRAIKQAWGPLTIRFEPTAHARFPEIYGADIALDHGGYLVTNGFGLAQRDDYAAALEGMHALGIHYVIFSFHGLQAHHDAFVGRQGAFDDLRLATQRVRDAGFVPYWQIYLDHENVRTLPAWHALATAETTEKPGVSLVYHRVSRRLWAYEALRPTLADLQAHPVVDLFDLSNDDPLASPQTLTAAAWLERWRRDVTAEGLRHPFEPPTWPPDPDFEHLSLAIRRDGSVWLDPMCAPPVRLGDLAEGRDTVMARLAHLPPPIDRDLDPAEVELNPTARDRLHPMAYSVRYVAISARRFG